MDNKDKWLMFKNYMHNELGITREDIRTWIEDAVRVEAEKLVSNEFKKFDIAEVVKKTVTDEHYFGSYHIKKDITEAVTKELIGRLVFKEPKE